METQGRNDLEGLLGTNLPTNNSKQITAEKHREVVKALIKSKYNIEDDELRELIYEGEVTLEQKLAGLFREVIKRGSFSGYNITLGVGASFNTSGILETATINASADDDSKVRVVFSESIENKVVIPIIYYEGTDWNSNNDIACPVMKIISSTELDIAFRELSTVSQSLKVEFIVL